MSVDSSHAFANSTGKIYAVMDTNGLAVRLDLTPGTPHDNQLTELTSALPYSKSAQDQPTNAPAHPQSAPQ